MVNSSIRRPALPTPDANADRPVPPVDDRPAWVVPCPELEAAVDQFEAADFALLAIGPADDPRWALMSADQHRYRAVFRLDTRAYDAGCRHPFLEVEADDPVLQPTGDGLPPNLVVEGHGPVSNSTETDVDPPAPAELGSTTPADWVVGRAGMRYRDLLPGRWGGQFIASHIHIPVGGPVPDYVHYHHVDFQLIFCHRGWVRVVYQDQGEPFILEAGDAVLQAPGLRHRVLEASDDLHVIEVSSPAEHATFVEHHLDLPNGSAPGQWYGGQRYVHHRAAASSWAAGADGIRTRSLELEPATNGHYAASVVELDGGADGVLSLPFADNVDFEFVTVLDGSLSVTDTANGDEATFGAGAAFSADDDIAWSARSTEPTGLLVVSRHRT